jgi:ankyrin repeat protein
MEHGADPDLTVSFGLSSLSFAVFNNNNIETINAILKKTKNVNAVHAGGYTPLMWAVYNEYDDTKVIKALLDKGADINFRATDGSTALSWALKKGNTATVELLKQAGAK